MKLARAQRIQRKWDEIESLEPDISDEQLFARTAEACNCDHGDVGEALWMAQQCAKHGVSEAIAPEPGSAEDEQRKLHARIARGETIPMPGA